jgi:2-polyprenyl-6-hydroxyphenyl methylase/3-demethylubiquinone-9 3-methyltransferase
MKDEIEAYEDEYYLLLPVDSGRIETLVRQFDLGPHDTVCEIGCAVGHFLAAIAGDIESGIGLDTAEAAIAGANRRKAENGLENIEFLQVTAQDFAAIEANVGQFDYVLLMDVTEHIDDATMAEVLIAARQLLKDNGQLVIHTPNLGYWLERLKDRGVVTQIRGHIAIRNEAQYSRLLENAGFLESNAIALPHYRQPLRLVDLLLMRIPVLGNLFRARLFIVAKNPS